MPLRLRVTLVDLFVLQRRLRRALVDAAHLDSVTDAAVIPPPARKRDPVWKVMVLVAEELGPEMAMLP